MTEREQLIKQNALLLESNERLVMERDGLIQELAQEKRRADNWKLVYRALKEKYESLSKLKH